MVPPKATKVIGIDARMKKIPDGTVLPIYYNLDLFIRITKGVY
jgi:hypothetical protein